MAKGKAAQAYTVQFAVRAIVELKVEAASFDDAAQRARADMDAIPVFNKILSNVDSIFEVVAVDVDDSWRVLDV